MTTNALVDVRHASRRYGRVQALDDVSLRVGPGEVVGLLGPNGAGTSTLINLILGLRRPDSGTVTLFGGPPADPAHRQRLGSTPQETALPESLRVGEVIDLVAGHYPARVPTPELLDRFRLTELAGRQCGGLSGGQRRRVSLALATVGRPDLLVLDEPTTGLDVDSRHELWGILRDLVADGATVLMSSHYLEEVEAFAGRVVVLSEGRIIADDTLDAVRDRVGVQLLTLRCAAALDGLPGVVTSSRDGDLHQLTVQDSDRVVEALVRSGVAFSDLRIRGASLEEALATISTQPSLAVKE